MDRNFMTYDPQAASVIIREELEMLAWRIQSNLASTGTNATGKTSRSLRVEVDENGGRLIGRPFFHGAETGRGKGGVPRNFHSIILAWMEAKGVHADDGDDDGFARGIEWKIRKKGTNLFLRGGRADIYTNEIPRTTKNISERLSRLIATKFIDINQTIGRRITGTIK